MNPIVVSLLTLTISVSVILTSGVRLAGARALSGQQNHVKFRRLPSKEFSAALGSSITIECEAGGSPPPTIHWLKNGKRISNSNRPLEGAYLAAGSGELERLIGLKQEREEGLVQSSPASSWFSLIDSLAPPVDEVNRIALSSTRSRLFIDCANLNDEAVYTCVAENAFRRISSHTKLTLIKPVPAPPQASASPFANSGSENDLLSGALEEVAALDLAASSAGQSSPASAPRDLTESRGVSGVGQQVNKQLLSDIESAVVAAATDKQQRLQQAAAQEQQQSSGLSAVPQCLNERAKPEPARIHMWTHNIVEVMRNSVLLYCRSNVKRDSAKTARLGKLLAAAHSEALQSGNALGPEPDSSEPLPAAQPSLTWTLPDDRQVDGSFAGKYEVLESGDLLIRDLRWSDMGTYVCSVADEQSSDSISTFVYPAAVKASTSKRASSGALHHQVLAPQFR